MCRGRHLEGQKYGILKFGRFVCIGSCNHRSVYIYRDAVPPIDAVSFRTIFSDNLQPIATHGKQARSTLLVDKHCGNGCSIKRAPLSVSYYNEISGAILGGPLFGRGVLPAQYCPCGCN